MASVPGDHRRRPGRNDRVVEAELLDVAVVRDMERVRVEEPRTALPVVHLARSRQLAEAAGELVDDRVLPPAQLFEVDLGLAEADPQLLGAARVVEQLRGVEQRLRGDAAAVEADAAGVLFGIDQRDLHTEFGGEEGGGIASRAGADHGQADIGEVAFAVGGGCAGHAITLRSPAAAGCRWHRRSIA